MINGICQVLFTTVEGVKTQVNMSAKEFAHLVSVFKREIASPFRDGFVWEKDGESFHYTDFGLLARNDHGRHRNFTLQYSVN